MPPGAVRPADRGGGASRAGADGGVVAGVRVLPARVQDAPAAALRELHLRLGQPGDGAASPSLRLRGRCACRRRVSFFLLFCFSAVLLLCCVYYIL